MNTFRWLLFPLTMLYAAALWIRHQLYDRQWLKSRNFDIPTIVIGNLVIGGAGKSPMTEYLVVLLKNRYQLATLSRGYGRQTKGFRLATEDSTAEEVGDEPLQFKRKFPNITVAVCEDRCAGIERLQDTHDLVLLDDAFQHRKLKPLLSILLFDFESLFQPIIPLPTGNFRDLMKQTRRADIIMISKCPELLTTAHKRHIERIIKAHSQQPIFYSQIKYLPLISTHNEEFLSNIGAYTVVLFTGIANPQPLIDYLKRTAKSLTHLRFADHHAYSTHDLDTIKKSFDHIDVPNKIIITTEKDYQRLKKEDFADYPLYLQPIAQRILHDKEFDNLVISSLQSR